MAEKPKDERDSEDEMQAAPVSIARSTDVKIRTKISGGGVTFQGCAPAHAYVQPRNAHQGGGFEEKHVLLYHAVNRHIMRSVRRIVTEDFDVSPQMIRVKEFFKGERGLHYDMEDNEHIWIDHLMASLMEGPVLRKNLVTAIVASAGMGKTTLLERLADETRRRCPEFECTRYKMVCCVKLQYRRYKNELKPSQFLFGDRHWSENRSDVTYDWVLNHQTQAIFFFDGLDEAEWSIDESSQKEMNPYERGSTSQIMYNLLSGRLLPQVKIVITSRELQVAELPVEARPGEIVSLIGLRRDVAKKLFMELVGDKGKETWTQISKLSPRSFNILSVPVFVVLAAALVARDPSAPPSTTITNLYNRIFLSPRSVENVQDRGNIMKVIQRLKYMAHQGMVERRMVFHRDDLNKYSLNVQDIRDYLLRFSGNNFLDYCLLKGDVTFSFMHESVQEFLSASFIAEMSVDCFHHFNLEYLQDHQWATVRLFVSGIIHEEHQNGLHVVPHRMEKQRIFRERILSMIKAGQYHSGADLLATIYESNCDQFMQSLPWLPSPSMTKLSPADAHMFASIWARRGGLKEEAVRLIGCEISDEVLNIMVDCLKDQKLQVGLLSLSGNKFTVKALNSLIQHVEADEIVIDVLEDLQELHWADIHKVEMAHGLRFTNEDGRITFEGDVNGSFLLNQANSDLVTTMTLDCRSNNHLDYSLDLISKFKVKFLDVHVDDETVSSDPILAMIHLVFDAVVKIHWWVYVEGTIDITNLNKRIEQNQVESLYLRIYKNSSFHEVLKVVDNCQVKMVTLMCQNGLEMKCQDIVDHAKQHSIEVEVILLAENVHSNQGPFSWFLQTIGRVFGFRKAYAGELPGSKSQFRSLESPLRYTKQAISTKDTPSEAEDPRKPPSQGSEKTIYSQETPPQHLSEEISASTGDGSIPFEEKTADVGPLGKMVNVGGCLVYFPPGCFENTQRVTISAKIDSKEWPPGRDAIAPCLDVKAPNLKKEATVTLTSWCVPTNDDEFPRPDVEILHYKEEEGRWEVIHRCHLGSSRSITFSCKKFSRVAAVQTGPSCLKHVMEARVYIFEKMFGIAVMLNQKLARKACSKKVRCNFGAKRHKVRWFRKATHDDKFKEFEMGVFTCEADHTVESNLYCRSPEQGFTFGGCGHCQNGQCECGRFKHTVNDVMETKQASIRTLALQSNQNAANIILRCQIVRKTATIKDVIVDNDISYDWYPAEQSLAGLLLHEGATQTLCETTDPVSGRPYSSSSLPGIPSPAPGHDNVGARSQRKVSCDGGCSSRDCDTACHGEPTTSDSPKKNTEYAAAASHDLPSTQVAPKFDGTLADVTKAIAISQTPQCSGSGGNFIYAPVNVRTVNVASQGGSNNQTTGIDNQGKADIRKDNVHELYQSQPKDNSLS